jgi:hypothetical protein
MLDLFCGRDGFEMSRNELLTPDRIFIAAGRRIEESKRWQNLSWSGHD